MINRLRTLWKLSALDLKEEKKQFVNPPLSVDGIKERVGLKKMATIVPDELPDLFPQDETDK